MCDALLKCVAHRYLRFVVTTLVVAAQVKRLKSPLLAPIKFGLTDY